MHFKTRPFTVILAFFKLLLGRAGAESVASTFAIDPAALLYDETRLGQLSGGAAQGRSLNASSALPKPWAEAIIRHLPVFDALVAAAPAPGQVVAGGLQESWQKSRQETLQETLQEGHKISSGSETLWQCFRALRPHQWAKNILVFVPLVLAHRVDDMPSVIAAFSGFLCFCLTASGIYILNDMMDLAQDRKHPAKCRRPFASGKLSVSVGAGLLVLCALGAIWLASTLPDGFCVVLLLYVSINMAYIFYLKSKLLVDVLALASVYTLRILGGERAIDVDMSFWLLAFSTFLFLSLALVKRYVELDTVGNSAQVDKNRVMGRGYRVADLDMLSQLGVASAFSAVLVLALYVDGAGRLKLYKTPEFIWLVCPIVLYVIGRIWVLAKRRELPDDPVLFIIKDWRSHLMGVIVIAIMLAAKNIGYTF